MKKLVILIALALVFIFIFTSRADSLECPPPSYDAGGFCKTVTGCPYGDSIPIDSIKCAPPPEVPPEPPQEPIEEVEPESWGK